MSKIEELLKTKRQAQIAELEGREPEGNQEQVDADLKKLQKESAKTADRRRRQARKANRKTKKRGLHITQHAWRRMGQRRMTIKHVYALWLYGEVRTLREGGRTAHVCTRDALRGMPRRERELLRRLEGAAILVQQQPDEGLSAVVTVLADGEDTHFG